MIDYDKESIHDTAFIAGTTVEQTVTVVLQDLQFRKEFTKKVRGNCTGMDTLGSVLDQICEEYGYEIPLGEDDDEDGESGYIMECDCYDDLMDYVVRFEITEVNFVNI